MTASLRDAFYRLFTIKEFEDFASTAPFIPKDPRSDMPYESCESIHNDMHGWCGGPTTKPAGNANVMQGHMSVVAVAAFDPLFWFHHW